MKKVYANLKSNLPKGGLKAYYATLNLELDSKTVIFPPVSHLALDSKALKKGAQSVYPEENGAFTGLIGLSLLRDLGINHVLIGHSEERALSARSNEFVKRSFDFFAHAGLEITLCVGEGAEQMHAGVTLETLRSQLQNIDVSYEKLSIAYEPIWAIGSGECAGCEQISLAHEAIKDMGAKTVLYGGSVNAKNAREILKMPLVDGALVGGASLDAGSLLEIVKIARELESL